MKEEGREIRKKGMEEAIEAKKEEMEVEGGWK